MILINTDNKIVLRYNNQSYFIDYKNGLLIGLINKIDLNNLIYITGSIQGYIIYDDITHNKYYSHINEYKFLNMIDKIYRTLIDNNIDIYNILPNNY